MDHVEYLVAHGVGGDFGRFRAAHPLCLTRGDRVVIRGLRGLELGEVLRPATARHAALLPDHPGELVRRASADDEAAACASAHRAAALLAEASQRIAEQDMGIELLDVEVLLDGRHAILHLVRWGATDVRDLVAALSTRFDLMISVNDLTAHEEHGCGSCGSGGGCGTGGCATGCGSARPEEVQAYFAALREKMEADTRGRVPLL